MLGYIKQLRQRYEHLSPKKMQHRPYRAEPKIHGAAAQNSMPSYDSPLINEERKQLAQKNNRRYFILWQGSGFKGSTRT